LEAYKSFSQIRQALSSHSTTCVDVVSYYLSNIKSHTHLNAFLEVFEEEALERAAVVDARLKSGNAGKLAGMVVGLKDLFCLQGHSVQAASQILNGFESQFTATCIQRLIDEDAIIIGRLNCDEFGMGSSNENSSFGPVLNHMDNTRVPGGSSGGSAVAVQARLCTASIGSDTGGSVRQPASFCGVVGMKPTYSRISRYGLIAYASSFDVVGVLSATVEDNALLLEVMAGADEYDSTVSRSPVPAYSQMLNGQKPAKVAYLKEALEADGIAPAVLQNLLASIEKLKQAGHTVEEVEFPYLKYALPTYYILITAEASSNLSRYDGMRFGHRSAATSNVDTMYKKSRSEGFGAEVKRRIMLGTFVLSASYYDAFYTKAQKVRHKIKKHMQSFFKDYDFLIMPTTPTTAFELGEHSKNPLEMYFSDVLTVQASVAGIPAISVPNGCDEQGLPFGLQILSDMFTESDLYAFANHYTQLK
jgi:aspartyl-tRNA(Asn)/glutamyl-tRNA(Gln) amidotransferase subunit A